MSETALKALADIVAEIAAKSAKNVDSTVDRAKDALLAVEALSKQEEESNE